MLEGSLILLRKKQAGGMTAEIKEDQSLLKGKERIRNLRLTVTLKMAEMANPRMKHSCPHSCLVTTARGVVVSNEVGEK